MTSTSSTPRTTRPADITGYDVLGSDGVPVALSPLLPHHHRQVLDLLARLSPRTLRARFLGSGGAAFGKYVEGLFDPERTLDAVVACVDGAVVAVASTHYVGAAVAEVAILVDDRHQGHGIGTLLLEDLMGRARRRGLGQLFAYVSQDNAAMLEVLRRSGLTMTFRSEGTCLEVTIPLAPDQRLLNAVTARERQAVSASLSRLVSPRTVAVVGAGRRRDGVGHQVVNHLVSSGYTGRIYAVNRSGRTVHGVSACRSVLELPRDVDLVVIAVPQESVLAVVHECAERSVGAVAVLTSGFAEAVTAADQDELRAVCRRAGMRLLGPNCIGIANTDPFVRMDASFLPRAPLPGPVTVAAQSGAVVATLLHMLSGHHVGVRSVVALGNASDVGPADVLALAAGDPGTGVVALYLESIPSPVALQRMAGAVVREKPVLMLKAGRTEAAASAAHSHSAAGADDDAMVNALCRRTGITRVDSLTELCDTAALHVRQPAPAGRRVAVVGNSGGAGVLAIDACEDFGLTPPDLTQHTMMRLRHMLPGLASVGRQVDVTAAATLDQLTAAIATVAEDPGVDALLVAVTALAHVPAPAVQEAVEKISQHNPGTAMVLCLADPACCSGNTVPVVDDPRRAVSALARAAAWAERRASTVTAVSDAVAPPAARSLVQTILTEHTAGGWLTPSDTSALLRQYQVPLAPSVGAVDPASAAEASWSLRFPVVLKGWGQGLVHKSAAGAVIRGLRDPDEVAAAARVVLERCGALVQGLLLQPEIAGDRELIVGGLRHERWGHLVMVGRGGVGTDVDPDRQWALAPVPSSEAVDLLRGLRCAPALLDVADATSPLGAMMTGLIRSVSQLVVGLPEVAELDLNPVILTAAGPVVADARVRVTAPAPAPPVEARAMT